MVNEIPHLNDDEADKIEGEITSEEASVALQNMKNCKSPGGFSAEFRKVYLKQNRHASS